MVDVRDTIDLDITGALTVGANGGATGRWEATSNGELTGALAEVGTAPTGANLIVDVFKNGVSVYTNAANRPTIVAGSTFSQEPAGAMGPIAAGTPGTVPNTSVGGTAQNAEVPTSTAAPKYTGAVSFVTGDVISLSVVQVGATVAGSDLNVSVQYDTV